MFTTGYYSSRTAKIAGKQTPYKAILLLSIMDLVEAGTITCKRSKLRFSLVSTYLEDLHSGTDSALSATTLIGLFLNLAA